MDPKLAVVLMVGVLAVSMGGSEAYRCYQCNSIFEKNCSDTFSSAGIRDCTGTACAKSKGSLQGRKTICLEFSYQNHTPQFLHSLIIHVFDLFLLLNPEILCQPQTQEQVFVYTETLSRYGVDFQCLSFGSVIGHSHRPTPIPTRLGSPPRILYTTGGNSWHCRAEQQSFW